MKFLQVSLLALVLTPTLAAWAPLSSSQRSGAPAPKTAIFHQSPPLQMSPNEEESRNIASTNMPVQKDLNQDAFAAEMNQELEQLQKEVTADPTMDAYARALHGIQQEATAKPVQPKPETTTPAKTTAGMGFGAPKANVSNNNAAKKKAFMEKHQAKKSTPTSTTTISTSMDDMIANQIVDQLEQSTPPPKATPEKTPRDLIQEAKATAKAIAMDKPKVEPKATIVPPPAKKEEPIITVPKATIVPPPPAMKKKEEVFKKTTIVPPTPVAKKEEPVVAEIKKPETIVPPAPAKKVEPVAETKKPETIVPPAPVAKKVEPVVAEIKKPKTIVPPTPTKKVVISKAAAPERKKKMSEEKPVVGKTANPFVKPAVKKEAIPERPAQAVAPKMETPPVVAKKVEKKVDPVVNVAKPAVDTKIAAEEKKVVVDRVKAETPKKVTPAPKKKMEVPRMEMPKMELPKVEIPKVNIPKVEMPKMEVSPETVEQAKEFAQKAGGAIFDAAQLVVKDGKDWVDQARGSLTTTRIEKMDMTYEEALGKIATSGHGFIKICAILGVALKEAVTFFADEFQKNKKNAPKAAATEPVTVVKKTLVKEVPKPEQKSASYLDQLQEFAQGGTQKVVEEEEVVVQTSKRVNLRDIVLPKPETVVEEIESKAAQDTKAGSIFGDFMSSATSFSEKLQATVGELNKKQGKETGKKDAPKMSKTVVKEKKKSPFFFMDDN